MVEPNPVDASIIRLKGKSNEFYVPMKMNSGFTMLEMLITVAILSILVAIAIPSFREMMDRNAVVTTSNDLLSSLLLARSEAVKRERVAAFSGNVGFTTWTVRVDTNDPPDRNVDTTIHEHQRPNNNVAIAANGNVNVITFNPRGRANQPGGLAPANDFFSITRNNARRFLCFSPTGRPYLKDPANGACP